MVQQQPHIIRKQILEVEVGDLSRSWQWQEQLSRFANGPLATRLAELFDEVADPHEFVQLDRLELQADMTGSGDWEDALLSQIESQLRQVLPNPTTAGGQMPHLPKSQSKSLMTAFFFFLENGQLPWWVSATTAANFEQELLQALTPSNLAADWEAKFKNAIRSNRVRQRLVGQFSEEVLTKLAQSFLNKSTAKIAENHAFAQQVFKKELSGNPTWHSIFWQTIFIDTNASIDEILARIVLQSLESQPYAMKNMPQSWVSQPTLKIAELAKSSPLQFLEFVVKNLEPNTLEVSSKSLQNEQEAMPKQAESEAAYFLRNAGLVILHPFLPAIFEKLGFVKHGEMVEAESAICLLQYLATGTLGDMEHELTLNKLLCGVPLDQPLERQMHLTQRAEKEAEALLTAVIGHWSALGNTSPDGLRGTFLCREGKLTRQPSGAWLLRVEQRSFDVLLGQLPWSFSTIKLPWMNEILTVEWS
ncbi:MAG: hypothetical protein GC192_20300 [Bacteroidetes bacterium]|nr:hypothetical protein [Bacteroidota bacterium]